MKLYKGITTLFILSIMSFGALASEKYCLKEERTKPIVVNIFGQSYQNNDDKRAFINGLNKSGIKLDRKILAEIAYDSPEAFKTIVKKAQAALN